MNTPTAPAEVPGFFSIPNACLRHANYIALSPYARALLFDLAAQFHGNNNGDLNAAWSKMQERGWRAQHTLYKALKELLTTGWIVQTRPFRMGAPGVKPQCALYALTFKPIDECGGKLTKLATAAPPDSWKQAVKPGAPGPSSTPKAAAAAKRAPPVSTEAPATAPKGPGIAADALPRQSYVSDAERFARRKAILSAEDF